MNGTTLGGWLRYARLLQEAGADGLELNLLHQGSPDCFHAGPTYSYTCRDNPVSRKGRVHLRKESHHAYLSEPRQLHCPSPHCQGVGEGQRSSHP
jgi:hypothetical protein